MNARQKNILIVACLVLAGMLFFPPWDNGRYSLLFERPGFAEQLDYGRLAAQCLGLTAIAAAGLLLSRNRTP